MRKIHLLAALLGTTVFLGGCPSFDVGGWISSVSSEGQDTKATFGGSFTCTPVYEYFPEAEGLYFHVIEGSFQYHDHDYAIAWKNRDRDLAFHGDYEQVDYIVSDGPEGLCEVADETFLELAGGLDGYCGPARLQPAPRTPDDSGYGQDLAYRIAVADGEKDEIWVWLGPAGEFGCPMNQDGSGPDDGSECGAEDLCYENYGILGGGNVTVSLPL